ncbi:MAG: tRNA (adenosine(37)-N6)-threonylcarbamoyltransferase complex dimerization subunit type 1 TsaB [Planctomycetes bacterium]|nr:tRNA (adenosine(37)-N6)-threonylcarbamoyltransferase complex dimerization subunit type 1 TsaB [Planctomycetota bacterium]
MFERTLILETSGKVGWVAVSAGERVLATRVLPEARRHARDLATRTRELLDEQGWKARDLTAVIVDIGPGSFTGLRVGIASAKALAFATGCRLYGVSAFDAIAAAVADDGEVLEIIADALQGQVYCQRFVRATTGVWVSHQPIRICAFTEWLAELRPGSLIAGPAVEMVRERLPVDVTVLKEQFPECGELLAVARRNEDRPCADLAALEPIYLRGSSAEEKRKRESGMV